MAVETMAIVVGFCYAVSRELHFRQSRRRRRRSPEARRFLTPAAATAELESLGLGSDAADSRRHSVAYSSETGIKTRIPESPATSSSSLDSGFGFTGPELVGQVPRPDFAGLRKLERSWPIRQSTPEQGGARKQNSGGAAHPPGLHGLTPIQERAVEEERHFYENVVDSAYVHTGGRAGAVGGPVETGTYWPRGNDPSALSPPPPPPPLPNRESPAGASALSGPRSAARAAQAAKAGLGASPALPAASGDETELDEEPSPPRLLAEVRKVRAGLRATQKRHNKA